MRLDSNVAMGGIVPSHAAGMLASLLSAAAIVCTPSSSMAAALMASDSIQRVVDGDTVILTNGGRARLIGINTPETVSPAQRQGAPAQCFGPEASEKTKALLPPGTAVKIESDTAPTDKFGRSLVYLYKADAGRAISINEQLVKEGFARAKAYKPNTRYRDVFEAAEAEARTKGVGLWGSCGDDVKRSGASGKGFEPSRSAVVSTASSSRPGRPARTQAERKRAEEVATRPLTNPGDVKNCNDFSSYAEAKAYYDLYFPQFGDVAKLDSNKDGVPCESLRGRQGGM